MTRPRPVVSSAPAVPTEVASRAKPSDETATLSDLGIEVTRVLLSVVSLASLAVGAIAALAGLTPVRIAALGIYCFVGIGSAVCAPRAGIPLPQRIAINFVAGFGLLVLGGTIMINARFWHPVLAFAIVAAFTAPLHALGIRRGLETGAARAVARVRGASRHRAPSLVAALQADATGDYVRLAATVAGFAICIVAASARRPISPGIGGFPGQIGIAWYLGLALMFLSFLFARRSAESTVAISGILLVLALTLTPAIVYGLPRSESAAKHVDLVEQIRTYHALTTNTAVYNGWPGFFAATAWICDITGIKHAINLATYWPPIMIGFHAASLRFLAGRFIRGRYECWVLVVLGILLDPLGYDYFSPQSVGLIFGICLYALATWRNPWSMRLPLILFGGVAVTVAHQLSPFVISGTFIVLVVFRQLRPWWLPALTFVPALTWTAWHYHALDSHISLGAIGHAKNFTPPQTTAAAGLARQPIVRETIYALVLGLAIIALFAGVRLLHKQNRGQSLTMAVCAGVGLVFVAINPYGNEGIFRAVIFGIPWLALLGIPVLTGSFRRPVLNQLMVITAAIALLVTYMIASFGLDSVNVIRRSDLAAFAFYRAESTGPRAASSALLDLGPGDLPDFIPRISERGEGLSLTSFSPTGLDRIAKTSGTAEQGEITRELRAYTGQNTGVPITLYALWSPNSLRYGYLYGTSSIKRFSALRDAFISSPNWTVAFQQGGTYVFKYVSG